MNVRFKFCVEGNKYREKALQSNFILRSKYELSSYLKKLELIVTIDELKTPGSRKNWKNT